MPLIINAHIVTVDAEHRVLENGAILVERGQIAAMGESGQLAREHPQAQQFDAQGKIVMPGLIDAHHHPYNYLVGGHGDDLEIGDLLTRVFYPFEQHISEEEAYVGALATFAEMIRSGVTCFNDAGGYMPDAIARAAGDIGIRGIVNRSTRDMNPQGKASMMLETTSQALDAATQVVERWHGRYEGRLRAWFGIRMPITASDDLIREIAALARVKQVGVHTHAATAAFEREASLALFGKRSLDRYRDLGLLGPNVCAVHMGFLDDDEIPTVVNSGLKVAHCPIAALTGAWGIMTLGRIPQLMDEGVTVAIGSDTNFGSGTLDMFRQMFVCATGHRESHRRPDLIGASKALDMATIEAARAMLWEDEIGSLEVGKRADLVVVDNGGLEWNYPGRDVVRSLVYSGSRADVHSVMIDGKWVLRDRVLTNCDVADLKHQVISAGAAWWRRSQAAAR
ncbi:hypothetical protein N234_25660 [Ralstonia pickettii DTP0602]|nr:hypothetical protein N234_25660 [Ralstonia pickettii DTP0602]